MNLTQSLFRDLGENLFISDVETIRTPQDAGRGYVTAAKCPCDGNTLTRILPHLCNMLTCPLSNMLCVSG